MYDYLRMNSYFNLAYLLLKNLNFVFDCFYESTYCILKDNNSNISKYKKIGNKNKV